VKPALVVVPPASPSADFLDTGCATVSQFLKELQCSRPTLDGLIKQGLPVLNIGTGRKRSLRIPRAAAWAWLRNRP